MNFEFTLGQKVHAHNVAGTLFSKRHFLPKGVNEDFPLPGLSVEVFYDLYKNNKRLVDFYKDSKRNFTNLLLEREQELCLTLPTEAERQKIVDCNLFSSGLSIVAIVPLQALLLKLPHNESELADVLLDFHCPAVKRDDMTPNQVREKRNEFKTYADLVFKDLVAIKRERGYENKVVVVLETRFAPSGPHDDLMLGKVDDYITYPHLASYVLFKAAVADVRLTRTTHTIFTSKRLGHISLQEKQFGPLLDPNDKSTYGLEISFATIL